MADYQAVGAMVQPPKAPDTLGSLSSILGIKQQQQALQGQAAQVQQAQLEAQATQGVNDFFTNWTPGDHIGADGTTDIDSAHGSSAYKGLQGLAKQAVDQSLIKIKSGQLLNAKSLLDLNDATRSYLATGTASVATDPDVVAGNDNGKAKVQAALQQAADQSGPAGARMALTYAKITDGVLKEGDLPRRLQALQKQALTAQQQIDATKPQPTPIQTKDGIRYVNTNPNAGQAVGSQVGQTVTGQGITPALTTGPGGTPIVVSPSGVGTPLTSGAAAGPAPPPQTKLQPQPRPDPVTSDQGTIDRYNAQMKEGREHVAQVSAAASNIQNGTGATQYRNAQIKDLLQSEIANNKPNITGPGSDVLHQVVSHLPGKGLTKYANDYDTLNHYLAQNSAAVATAMGVPATNAGQAQAEAAAGSTHQTPGALLEVTKTNDAMNTGLHLYNQALAKATNNGADPSKVAALRNAWGANFDVNVMRYDDALRSNDKAEIDALQAKGKAFMKQLGQKRRVLHSLADTGDLP